MLFLLSVLEMGAALTAAQPAGEPADEIVVTADWYGLEDLAATRDGQTLVEQIGAAALAIEPSSDVTDALARVAGVTVQTEKGEDRFVQLRGLRPALNSVTVDGILVGAAETAGGGRQAPLDLYSTSLVGALEVIKVQTPNMDGQGIGGTVNIVSPDLLAGAKGLRGTADGRVGTGGQITTPAAEASSTLSYKSADGRWALQGGLAAEVTETERGEVEQNRWAERDGIVRPDRVRRQRRQDQQARLGGMVGGALELAPDHVITGTASLSVVDESDALLRYEDRLSAADPGTLIISPRGRLQSTDTYRETSLARLSGTHAAALGGGELVLTWRAAWSQSELDESWLRWETGADDVVDPVAFSLSDDSFLVLDRSFDEVAAIQMDARARRTTDLLVTDESVTLGGDLAWSPTAQLTITAGVQQREADRAADTTYVDGRIGTFYGVETSLTSVNSVAGEQPLLLMDLATLESQLAGIPGAIEEDQLSSLINSTIEDYTVTEKVSAAYLMATWEQGPLSVVGGARFEKTDRDATGNVLSAAGILPDERSAQTEDWLPMLAATWRPDDAWVMRASVGQRVGRPDFELIAPRAGIASDGFDVFLDVSNPDLAPRKSTNYDLSAAYYPADDRVIGIALFRKDIEDEIIQTTAIVQGAPIVDELLAAGLPPDPAYSFIETLYLTTVRNLEAYQVDGVELFASSPLPGVSAPWDRVHLSAAVTLIEESGDFVRAGSVEAARLPEQTDRTATFAAAYQADWGLAWVGYSYGGGYLSVLSDDSASDDEYQAATHLVDAKLAYKVNDRLNLTLDGRNLLDTDYLSYQGTDKTNLTIAERMGRSVYLGVSYRWP